MLENAQIDTFVFTILYFLFFFEFIIKFCYKIEILKAVFEQLWKIVFFEFFSAAFFPDLETFHIGFFYQNKEYVHCENNIPSHTWSIYNLFVTWWCRYTTKSFVIY